MPSPGLRRPRGTADRLPADAPAWDGVLRAFARECRLRNFQPISTPTFESTELFDKGTGATTDIVQKEMYTFDDRGGDSLTLRPEGTPSIVRAYQQHGMHVLPQPVKLYYVLPVFRYDRPQAGRLREHHQIGAEALGDPNPAVDAEVIDLLWSTLRALGISDLALHVNSLGDPESRPEYRAALVAFFTPHAEKMCADCQQRLTQNPLRLLDCKKPPCARVSVDAPRSLDYLGDAARDHFDTLRSLLGALDIPCTLDHRLVRGLDYYNRTVFEIVPPDGGAQSTVGGGGRYDYLAETLGGSHLPGVGFGSGIERILLNRRRVGLEEAATRAPEVYVAPLADTALTVVTTVAAGLRQAGVATEVGFAAASPRSHLRRANAVGARVALIVGNREVEAGRVSLKPLDGGDQVDVALDDVVSSTQAVLAAPAAASDA